MRSCVRNRRRMAAYYIAECAFRIAVLLAAAVFNGLVRYGYRHFTRRDLQRARNCLNRITAGQVNRFTVDCAGDLNIAKRAVGIYPGIGSARRAVDNGKGIAFLQSFNFVFRRLGICVQCPRNGISGLLTPVVNRIFVIDGNRHFSQVSAVCYSQRSQGLRDGIVRGIGAAPVNTVRVAAAARIRLSTVHCEGDGIPCFQSYLAGSLAVRRKCPADISCPVTVGNLSAILFGQFRSVICFFRIGRADRKWQRLDHQETVAGKESNGIVGIIKDSLRAVPDHLYTIADYRFLLSACARIGAGIFFTEQRLSLTAVVQHLTDGGSVLVFECCIINCDILFVAGQLIGVGETGFKRLPGVIVGPCTARVGVPLVSSYHDIHTGRLHSQGARNIDNAVVLFRQSLSRVTLDDNQILRCGRACSGIRLRSCKRYACNSVPARVAGDPDRIGRIV